MHVHVCARVCMCTVCISPGVAFWVFPPLCELLRCKGYVPVRAYVLCACVFMCSVASVVRLGSAECEA